MKEWQNVLCWIKDAYFLETFPINRFDSVRLSTPSSGLFP